jgi:hypothetical protein
MIKNPNRRIIDVVFLILLGLGVFSCGKQSAESNTPQSALPDLTTVPTQISSPIPTNTPLPALEPGMKCAVGLPRPNLTMDEFVGINSFNDVPNEVNAVAGILREYHPWAWDEAELGQIKWNPSYAGGNPPWNFDAWYMGLKNITPPVAVSPVLMNDMYGSTRKPIASGFKGIDPVAYVAHAQYFYQFAARYGSVSVPDTNLTLAPDQPRLSGLNLVSYIEDWNEPDKGFGDLSSNFSPDEYAAMASADYDGHCGKLGAMVGARNADPSMRVVIGGIADGVDKYYYFLDGVRLWANAHRGGSLPFDVINIHHYSTTGSTGKSPEEDNLIQQLQRVTSWRDKYAPDKEVWYSEFGWDTHPESSIAARAIGPYTIEEVQGQWIVRAYLLAKAAGVDRAFQFMVRDTTPLDKGQFNTSGLTGPKPDYVRKPSWYYVYTLKNRLTDTVFIGEQESGNPLVMVYLFENPQTGQMVYVLWSPTSDGTIVPGHSLTLDGKPASIMLVSLSDTSITGTETSLSIKDGTVNIDVSESPVFVIVNK